MFLQFQLNSNSNCQNSQILIEFKFNNFNIIEILIQFNVKSSLYGIDSNPDLYYGESLSFHRVDVIVFVRRRVFGRTNTALDLPPFTTDSEGVIWADAVD
jgi:hypothetical protein